MKIRTNRFLQLFITLLFMLEFLAPAFSLSTGNLVYDFEHSARLQAFHHPGIMLALLSQPVNENEEGREGASGTEGYNHPPAVPATYFVNIGLTEVCCTSPYFNGHPPLFLLHHTYLI